MSASEGMVLLADVGGTNVRFALADPSRAQPLLVDSIRRYRVADHETFTDAALAWFGDTGVRVHRAVLAFAGRISGDEVRATNNPWRVSRERVRTELVLDEVVLINDFAAMSLAVTRLRNDDMRAIGSLAPPTMQGRRTFAVVGPGTGLGVGALLLRDGRAEALETEGGHTAFAPGTNEEIELLRRLHARFGRVSNERLLCGSGLSNMHEVLGEMHGRVGERLPAEEISRRANTGEDAACVHTLQLFCEVLGAVAGDFVLAFGAWDGIWLGGGMTPLLLDWLGRGGFRRRFEAKGRLSESMVSVPSVAILHPDAGLLGAAVRAQQGGRA